MSFSSPRDAIRRGIVAISQELTLARTLSVAENVLLRRMPRRQGIVDWRTARQLAAEALAKLDLDLNLDLPVERLSIELQQQVEVARALSASSRVLILDEATSSLSERAATQFLHVVRRLADSGVAVVIISHRFAELYSTATRAIVLRDGRLIGDAPLPETSQVKLVSMMVGRDLDDLYGRRARTPGAPVLAVEGLRTREGEVRDVSFQVRSGEILGVAGLVGSGKSTLALALAGGTVGVQGSVTVNGRKANLSSRRAALASGIGYVTDDRKRNGLLRTRSVQQNMSLWWTKKISRWNVINSSLERSMATQASNEFGIVTRSQQTNVMTLSGGNQQKVMLGRIFAMGLEVLVLNEPTRGIDVRAKSEIYGFMQDAAERGAAIVMVSSELPELLGVTDRIVTIYQGEISGEFYTLAADEGTLAHAVLNPSELEILEREDR